MAANLPCFKTGGLLAKWVDCSAAAGSTRLILSGDGTKRLFDSKNKITSHDQSRMAFECRGGGTVQSRVRRLRTLRLKLLQIISTPKLPPRPHQRSAKEVHLGCRPASSRQCCGTTSEVACQEPVVKCGSTLRHDASRKFIPRATPPCDAHFCEPLTIAG